MSVLTCHRSNCENIMCNRYSPIHGYICPECFKELIESGAETNIRHFMFSEPAQLKNEEAAIARFNIEFPLTYEK